MNTFKSSVFLLGLVGCSLTACTKDDAQPADAQQAWSCTPPAQAPAPSASQEDFDRYSWQMFAALNWPAEVGQRGQPDCEQSLGGKGPVVWQTYKTAEQIFLPDAANPGSWDAGEIDTSLSKMNVPVLKNTAVVNFVDQAVGGWLIDQRGNPTYYATYVNQSAYDYIVSNEFHNIDVVAQADSIDFPDTASEIKSSWRVLTEEDDASRYLTMQATIDIFDVNGQATGESQAATVGLVGLHIVTKAPDHAQRIWSTFEHVDNVPSKENLDGKWMDKPAEGASYSYFSSEASATDLNHASCLWQQQDTQLVCVPKEGTFTKPNPLSRVTPIPAETQKVNASAQENLSDTVFKHYQLIATQHQSESSGQATPAIAANVTMESFVQPTSSCIGCHAMATPAGSEHKADFTFLFKLAQKPAEQTTEQ